MLNHADTVRVIQQVISEYKAKYEEALQKKTAINNKRTKEGLEQAILTGIDDFEAKDIQDVTTIEDYETKLRERVERSTFFYMNEPLIWRVVRKFDNLNVPESERYAAAAQGFVVAQNIFDPSRGFQFSTIAWHIMFNEIIGLNKKYQRQHVIKQPDRKIIIRDDCVVTGFEKSRDARIVRVKGEPVELLDIHVIEKGDHPYTYRYIYFSPKDLAVGYTFKRGDVIGWTAGVETELASMDSYMNSDNHGDVVFHNPLASVSEEFERSETQVMRQTILDKMQEVVDALDELERFIYENRLLPKKPKARAALAKELGVPDNRLARLEANLKDKLLREFKAKGIEVGDLSVFH